MSANIIVSQAKDFRKALRLITQNQFLWLYLGKNIKQRENISQVLGKEKRYSIGDLLQVVAHQHKQSFLDLIAKLGRNQKNKLHWWASDIASKNPLVNDFFLLQCYMKIFEEICNKREQEKEKCLVIFIENRWLYWALLQDYKGRDSFIFLSRKSVFPELLKLLARGVAVRGFFLLKVIVQCWRLRGMEKINLPGSLENKRHIYIYSWIGDHFFKSDNNFEDPYFGRLEKILNSGDFEVRYITPLFLSCDVAGKCLKHGRVIFLGKYIDFWSVMNSVFSVLYVSILPDIPLSLRILLWYEMAYQFSKFSFSATLLQYFAFKTLLRTMNQRSITIIYPFENQPWDKMLCMAVKKLDSYTFKLIGYQHSTVPILWLNYFLGEEEAKEMPLPNIIVTNGQYALNLLKKAGYEGTEFINGGALRYEYLFNPKNKEAVYKNSKKTVLVILTQDRYITVELLVSLLKAFGDLEKSEIEFLIKFHPQLPFRNLNLRLDKWPKHFKISTSLISDLLKKVDLLIYSSSTVGLEARFMNIPVIKYYSECKIDLDPFDDPEEWLFRSCFDSNIRDVVLSVLNQTDNCFAGESISDIKKLITFFSPVNEDVWRKVCMT